MKRTAPGFSVLLFLLVPSVFAAEGFVLSALSDRGTYISGMTASFTVTLAHPSGKPVNMNNKKLAATFPDEDTGAPMTQVSETVWRTEVVTSGSGMQTFRVRLVHDNPRFEQALLDAIAQADGRIAYWQARLAETTRPILRRVIEGIIAGLKAVRAGLVEVLDAYRRPLAEAEKTVYVYPKPTVTVTSPATGSFLRQTIGVTVEVTGELGGELTVSVDGDAFSVQTIALGAHAAQFDTTAVADGGRVLAASFAPEGFAVVYYSAPVAVLVDNTPPVLTAVSPATGHVTGDNLIPVELYFTDSTSGIDVSAAALTVNDVDVTEDTEITGESAVYEPVLGYSDGTVTWRLHLADEAGNAADFSGSFTVDTVPPDISFFAFARTPTNDQYPLLEAVFSDITSGVDMNTVLLTLNGADVSAEMQWTETGIVWAPQQALAEGVHTARIEVSDLAGNSASASASVEIDITPPPAPVVAGVERTDTMVTMWGDTTPDIVAVIAEAEGAEVASAAIMSWQVVFRKTDGNDFTYSIKLVDAAGNIGPALAGAETFGGPAAVSVEQFTMLADAVKAQVTDEGLDATNMDPVPIVIQVIGEVAACSITLNVRDGAVGRHIAVDLGPANMTTVHIAGLADGIYDATLEVKDAAGNTAGAEYSFVVDRTPPQITFTTPAGIRTWPMWHIYLNGADEESDNVGLRAQGREVYSKDAMLPVASVVEPHPVDGSPNAVYKVFRVGRADESRPFANLYAYAPEEAYYGAGYMWENEPFPVAYGGGTWSGTDPREMTFACSAFSNMLDDLPDPYPYGTVPLYALVVRMEDALGNASYGIRFFAVDLAVGAFVAEGGWPDETGLRTIRLDGPLYTASAGSHELHVRNSFLHVPQALWSTPLSDFRIEDYAGNVVKVPSGTERLLPSECRVGRHQESTYDDAGNLETYTETEFYFGDNVFTAVTFGPPYNTVNYVHPFHKRQGEGGDYFNTPDVKVSVTMSGGAWPCRDLVGAGDADRGHYVFDTDIGTSGGSWFGWGSSYMWPPFPGDDPMPEPDRRPEHLVRDVFIYPNRPGWLDTCVSRIVGTKIWVKEPNSDLWGSPSKVAEGSFGSPSVRQLCQVITVEPNVLVAGQEIDLRIRGGFPREVTDLSVTLTDAGGQSWDALVQLGDGETVTFRDEETGEVLPGANGQLLTALDHPWGVIEEDPYNADRWRTIIARARIPDDTAVGLATIQFSCTDFTGPRSFTLKNALNVMKMELFNVDKTRKYGILAPCDMEMATKVIEEKTVPEYDPTILVYPTIYPDAFHVRVTFAGDLSPTLKDSIVVSLVRRATGEVLPDMVLTETANASRIFTHDEENPVTVTVKRDAPFDPDTAEFCWIELFVERTGVVTAGTMCLFETGKATNVFTTVRRESRLTLTAPFNPAVVDTIPARYYIDGQPVDIVLTETGVDTEVFRSADGTVTWSVMWVGYIPDDDWLEDMALDVPLPEHRGFHDDQYDSMLVIMSDTANGIADEPLLLLETEYSSLDFEGLMTEDEPLTIANADSLYAPTYPTLAELDQRQQDIHGFYIRLYDVTAKAGDKVTMRSLHQGAVSTVDVEMLESDIPGVLESAKPVILCEGEITSSFRQRYEADYVLGRSSEVEIISKQGVVSRPPLIRSVVLGHSIAAGYQAFTLRMDLQDYCFGKFVTRSWGEYHAMPSFDWPGFPEPLFDINERILYRKSPYRPGARLDYNNAILNNFAVPGVEMNELVFNKGTERPKVSMYDFFKPSKPDPPEPGHKANFRKLPAAILLGRGTQIEQVLLNEDGSPKPPWQLPSTIFLMCGANDLIEGFTGFPYGDPDYDQPGMADEDWDAIGNPNAEGRYLFKPDGNSFVTKPERFEKDLRYALDQINHAYETRAKLLTLGEIGKCDVVLFTMVDVFKSPIFVPIGTTLFDNCLDRKPPFLIEGSPKKTLSIFSSRVSADPAQCKRDYEGGLVSIAGIGTWMNGRFRSGNIMRIVLGKPFEFKLNDMLIIDRDEQRFVNERRLEMNRIILALRSSDEYPNLRIRVVDLAAKWDGIERKKMGDPDFALDQGHLSSQGHKRLAKDILDAMQTWDWPFLHPMRGYQFYYGDIDE